jgi:hypothetical protein
MSSITTWAWCSGAQTSVRSIDSLYQPIYANHLPFLTSSTTGFFTVAGSGYLITFLANAVVSTLPSCCHELTALLCQ